MYDVPEMFEHICQWEVGSLTLPGFTEYPETNAHRDPVQPQGGI
jgi:hypothetical protein